MIGLDDVVVGLRAAVVAITLLTIIAFSPQTVGYISSLRRGTRVYGLELAAGIVVGASALLLANVAIFIADFVAPERVFGGGNPTIWLIRFATFFLIPAYFMHVTAWYAVRGRAGRFWLRLLGVLVLIFAVAAALSAALRS